jgi:hypothetical protein
LEIEMKPILTALLLSLFAAPVFAQAVSFPTLTYPGPAPETQPVTQEEGGIRN